MALCLRSTHSAVMTAVSAPVVRHHQHATCTQPAVRRARPSAPQHLTPAAPVLQLQLTPLAGYSVPCSTTPMAAACATASGHIFLGATDGNVYQVQYGKRQACRLTCVSRSFLSMLGAGVLPGYLAKRIWNAVPIRLLVVDNDRHFLYTLSESHTIRVRPWPPARTCSSACVSILAECLTFRERVAKV